MTYTFMFPENETCPDCGGYLRINPIQVDVMMIPPVIQMKCVDCKKTVCIDETNCYAAAAPSTGD